MSTSLHVIMNATFKIKTFKIARKRIKHECLVRIEYSVPREAGVMPKYDPRDGNLCLYRTTITDTFSCIPFIYYLFHVIKCIQCADFTIIRPR